MASLPVVPLAWFVALQEHPPWMPGAYLGYLLVVIAVPGTMFWRRLTGGTGWFAADAVLGTAFGLAIEALLYPIGMFFDMPFAALLMPALAFGMVRAFPQRKLSERPTPWWATAGAMVAVGVAAAWFVRVGSRLIPLSGPSALRPNSDAPHNLALAAELTHHFPPKVPYADGKWMTSHWAAYDHIASSHWITTIPLDVLTHRIVPFAWILLTVLGAAAVGMLLTGRAVAAPIAAGLTVFAGDLAAWPMSDRVFADGPFSLGQLTNPPQAFSTVLLLPLIAVTALLLRRKPGQTRAQLFGLFVAAGVLIAALALTKATTLPVYAIGLAAAWVYVTVRAGRLNLRGLVLGVGVAAAYALTFFLVLRGALSSVLFDPGATFKHLADRMGGGGSAVAVIAAVVVLGWLMPAVGALLIRRRLPGDPMVVFLLVGFLAAVAAGSLLYDDGQAQLFFVRTGFMYGVLLATWGLGSLARPQYYVAAVALLIGVNSGSDDLIATNLHCHRARASHCLTGSYWIAGYAERRVLVQGWAYKARVDDSYPDGVQSRYWSTEKLRLNDEAFTNPTRDVLETLRTRYGVQWLLLDERVSAPPNDLDRLTELRFQFGTVRVYQLYPPPPPNAFPTQTPTPTPMGSPTQTPSTQTPAPSQSLPTRPSPSQVLTPTLTPPTFRTLPTQITTTPGLPSP